MKTDHLFAVPFNGMYLAVLRVDNESDMVGSGLRAVAFKEDQIPGLRFIPGCT
ncbi:unknown [Clostridium sp. CAG:448]|nr:unknown [Clostridium sp. CAG:448]